MEGRFPCPIDEHGVPLIPEDFNVCYDVCLKGIKYTNRHHLGHPRAEHKAPIERQYREVGSMVVGACVCKHADYHNTYLPPRKPSRQVMIDVAAGDIVPTVAPVIIRSRHVES